MTPFSYTRWMVLNQKPQSKQVFYSAFIDTFIISLSKILFCLTPSASMAILKREKGTDFNTQFEYQIVVPFIVNEFYKA